MLSATKEILLLSRKPVIQYFAKEAMDSGIAEIIYVTLKSKVIIEKYFKNR